MRSQIDAYLTPSNESTSAVNAWLNENGLQATALSSAGDWLSVQMPVSTANDILDADFSVFTHPATGKQTVRTLSYSIPTDLVSHLSLVHPTTSCVLPRFSVSVTFLMRISRFPDAYGYTPIMNFTSSGLTPESSSGPCDVYSITPACLQWLYNIPSTPAKSDGNKLAVTGYVDEWPQYSDLEVCTSDARILQRQEAYTNVGIPH